MRSTDRPRGVLPISPENYPAELPEFSTEEELREFWDTHDASFYWDQFEDVTDSPPAHLTQGPSPDELASRNLPRRETTRFVAVRLSVSQIEAVKEEAARRHVPYPSLLRSWLGERIALETGDDRPERRKAS